MKLKPTLLAILLCSTAGPSIAQTGDLLDSIPNEPARRTYVTSAYKSSRVIMSHSTELLKPGVLDLRILHRFGNVNGGLKQFFGLDQATIRLGLDYGVSENLSVGLGRSSYKKEADGFAKYRILRQSTGPRAVPLSLVVAGGAAINTLPWEDPARKNRFSSRMAYYGQLIAGRKFSDGLTLQLMPTIVHRNLVPTPHDPNDLYALGAGGRLRLSKRLSLNVDYYYVMNQNDALDVHNPLSIGFDIETGGHVFQLHFTNASGMNERAFLAETTNNWGDGDIQFGFNISRAFQLKKKRN